MAEASMENITKSSSLFAAIFVNHYILPDVNFSGNCLIDNNIKNKYINVSYILNQQTRDLITDFTLGNCLFGSINLTKNADRDKYIYATSGIGFNSRSEFSLPNGSVGKDVIIFGADMSSSLQIDNKGKDILIFVEGPTQELDDTRLRAKAKYPINFTQLQKGFLLILHSNGQSSFLFVVPIKYISVQSKIL